MCPRRMLLCGSEFMNRSLTAIHDYHPVMRHGSRIPRIQGGQESTFTATANLTSTTHRQVWARPPIDADFQVLMFTSSGLIVRFLKVFEKSNYQSIKWVRYLTKASGSYQIRVCSPFVSRSRPAHLIMTTVLNLVAVFLVFFHCCPVSILD